MGNCVFCNIIKGTIESARVYEDDHIVAFMDIDPINIGHVLIVTKSHRLDLDDLTNEEIMAIMGASKLIVKALRQTYTMDGYSIMQNGGLFNDVGHYHMHIFPRQNNDGFGWTYGEAVSSNLQSEAQRLKAAISDLNK